MDGSLEFLGGGGQTIAFTRNTDGAGAFAAASSTTHFGSPLGGSPNAAITLSKGGAGIYRLTWDKTKYGLDRFAFATAEVALTGDWTHRVTIDRTTGYVEFTFLTGGVATNVVSGAISFLLVFGPMGY